MDKKYTSLEHSIRNIMTESISPIGQIKSRETASEEDISTENLEEKYVARNNQSQTQTPEEVKSFARGAWDAGTFGLGPLARAGADYLTKNAAYQLGLGKGTTWETEKKQEEEKTKKAQEAAPKSYVAGELATALIPVGGAAIGAAKLGKAGWGLAKSLKLGVPSLKDVGAAAKVIAKDATAPIGSAAVNLAKGQVRKAGKDVAEYARSIPGASKEAAKFGGGLTVADKTVGVIPQSWGGEGLGGGAAFDKKKREELLKPGGGTQFMKDVGRASIDTAAPGAVNAVSHAAKGEWQQAGKEAAKAVTSVVGLNPSLTRFGTEFGLNVFKPEYSLTGEGGVIDKTFGFKKGETTIDPLTGEPVKKKKPIEVTVPGGDLPVKKEHKEIIKRVIAEAVPAFKPRVPREKIETKPGTTGVTKGISPEELKAMRDKGLVHEKGWALDPSGQLLKQKDVYGKEYIINPETGKGVYLKGGGVTLGDKGFDLIYKGAGKFEPPATAAGASLTTLGAKPKEAPPAPSPAEPTSPPKEKPVKPDNDNPKPIVKPTWPDRPFSPDTSPKPLGPPANPSPGAPRVPEFKPPPDMPPPANPEVPKPIEVKPPKEKPAAPAKAPEPKFPGPNERPAPTVNPVETKPKVTPTEVPALPVDPRIDPRFIPDNKPVPKAPPKPDPEKLPDLKPAPYTNPQTFPAARPTPEPGAFPAAKPLPAQRRRPDDDAVVVPKPETAKDKGKKDEGKGKDKKKAEEKPPKRRIIPFGLKIPGVSADVLNGLRGFVPAAQYVHFEPQGFMENSEADNIRKTIENVARPGGKTRIGKQGEIKAKIIDENTKRATVIKKTVKDSTIIKNPKLKHPELDEN